MHKINVPVFMACQWEDEQTGGHCPDLVRHFTGTKQKWFTFTNGAHIDSLDPETYNRWYDFLQLFVAHQAPIENAAVTRAAAPVIYQAAMGLPQTDVVTLPADPIQAMPTYSAALAAFKKLPQVRVLFDNGAGTVADWRRRPRATPTPGFEQDFSSLPVAGTTARTWYFGGRDAQRHHRRRQGVNAYTSERARASAHRLRNEHRYGRAVGQRVAVEVEVEAEPDGHRGVLRLGAAEDQHHRHRRRSGSPLGALVDARRRPAGHDQRGAPGRERDVRPERLDARERAQARDRREQHLQAEEHAARADPDVHGGRRSPMPTAQFVKVVIPLYYEGHAYRAGTRIRVTIAAPNGTQPIWSFSQTEPKGTAKVSIAFSPTMPSSLILPVVPGVTVPTPLPAVPEPAQRAVPGVPAMVNTVGDARCS